MTLAAWLRRQQRRPLAAHQRCLATALLAVVLTTASAAFILIRPASSTTPSRTHGRSTQAAAQIPTSSAAALPRGVTSTVDGFLVGYLRYLYGHGPASGVKNVTAAFTGSLEQHPPRVPPELSALHPRVLRLVAAPAPSGKVAVTAIVTDGEVIDYRVCLFVTGSGGGWRVSGLDTGS